MTTNQFTGPRAKLRAVRRNANLFRSEMDRYIAANQNAIRVEIKPPTTSRVVIADLTPVPEDLSVIAGEIAYQLRSTLDLLACDLAQWSGQTDFSGVYFPIAKTEIGYSEKGTRKKIAKLKPELQATDRRSKAIRGIASSWCSMPQRTPTNTFRSLPPFLPSKTRIGRSLAAEISSASMCFSESQRRTSIVQLKLSNIALKFDAVHIKLHCHIVFAVEPIVGEPVPRRSPRWRAPWKGSFKNSNAIASALRPDPALRQTTSYSTLLWPACRELVDIFDLGTSSI